MSGNNDSIVLEEEIDPNYVPTEEEVVEYATWMGMDMEADRDLFWIAREGLMAPLPQNWKPCKSKETEEVYYFNFATAESSWDHPCDGYYKRLYEEEKKKKETSKKVESDEVRAKARKDVDQLMGKGSKKKSRSESGADAVRAKASGGPAEADKKALPGIRGKSPLPDTLPPRNSLSRDSTPERGRSDKKVSTARPASADAALGAGRGGGLLSSIPLSSSAPSPSDSERPSSPEFTDSDVSPLKSEKKTAVRGLEEHKSVAIIDKKSKNSRLHSAVASSSDFGSPDVKKNAAVGSVSSGLKPKAVLGRIGLAPPESENGGADAISVYRNEDQKTRREGSIENKDNYDRLREEINKLAASKSDLDTTVEALRSELDREQKKNEVLTTSQNLLQTQLSTAREENRNMRSELNREIERRARIELELKEIGVQCVNAKKENATHVKTIQELRAEIHNLEGEMSLSKYNSAPVNPPQSTNLAPLKEIVEKSVVDSFIFQLQNELTTGAARICQLEALQEGNQKDKIRQDEISANTIAELQRSVRSLSTDRDSALKDADRKQMRIVDLEDQLRDIELRSSGDDCQHCIELQHAIDKITQKLAQISKDYSETIQSLEESQFRNRRLESQVSIRQSELEDAESRLSAFKKRVTELQDRSDDAEVQNKSFGVRLGLETDERSRIEAQLRSSKEDVKSLQAQVSVLERADLKMLPRASENTELHDEISSWKNKFKGTQGDLDDLKAVLSRKDREIFRLENELASQTAGLQSLRKESGLAHSNVDTVEINQMLRQREEDLMEKLKTAQSEVATLQSELTASQRKCRELEEDLMESRSQTDRIAGKEKKNFETVSKLEVSVVELEQKNSALHRELNEVSIKGTLMASSDMLKSKSLEMELEHLRIELDSIRNIKMHPVNSVPTPVTIEYQHATKNCIDSTEFVDLRRAHDYLAVELGTSKMHIKQLEDNLHSARDEKEKLYFEYVHSQGQHVESLNAKLASAMEDSMLHRQALMEAKLEVEKYRKQESMMQEDLIFLRKDLSTASESKKIIQGQLNASELVVAELRVNCHSAQEENRTLKSKISMLIQEIDDYTKRLKELDQQNYFLTQDKQRLQEALKIRSTSFSAENRSAAMLETGVSTATINEVQSVTQGENEIAFLHNKVLNLKLQRDSLKSELTARTADCQIHLSTIADLRKELLQVKSAQSFHSTDKNELPYLQKEDARNYFESLLSSYSKKIEATLHEKLASLRILEEDKSLKPSLGSQRLPINSLKGRTDSIGEFPELKFSGSQNNVNEFQATTGNDTLESLRDLLSKYVMKNDERSQCGGGVDLSAYNPGLKAEEMKKSLEDQRKLIQDLKCFVRSENDVVRKKQLELSKDRDKWRKEYQHNVSHQNDPARFRAMKKSSGEQLNRRAQGLNEMVRQLREIQLWIAARDESISRYGTFLGSSSAIPSSSLSSAKPDVVRSGIGVLDESLIGHIEILQHIKEEMEDDFTLLSLDETPEKKVPMLPPKQAASPTRQSKPQFAWSGDYTHGSMLAKSESPPQLDTSSRFQIEHKVNTITAPKSASFASRLGNLPPSAVSSRIDIDGYSNNLRSSINAYDLHAEWLGNLKREVASYGSGAAMRHSFDESKSAFNGMPNASVAFPNSNTRDTKRVADFLSLSKSIYTNRKDTADENIFTRDSDALNARQPLNAALRRSIDIGDMYRERRTNAPATYRL